MNNHPVHIIPTIEPCYVIRYCPYGPLVESFEYHPIEHRCDVFGHACPAFTMAEDVAGARAFANSGNVLGDDFYNSKGDIDKN